MANIRYFNLKALNNVKIKNFEIKSNVRKVFDPGNGFTNFGILTEGNTNFPQHVHGAGVQGTMLTNSFDMGGIAVASVDTIDWGSIA
tara:strand:+ start:472 stop:732 length:261 start_codon:yes stop_codon:yes gene_type:complete